MNVSNRFTVFSILGIVTLFVAVSSISANAEQVTLSSRVKNHVNVRDDPTVDSAIVGTLSPNETAVLVKSVPHWYEIKMDSGIPGYVSKAWTVLTSRTSDETGKTDLIIGSWNIKWFGYYSDDRHDYTKMAEIIEKFDVVAIQELRGSHYRDRLNRLVVELANQGFNYTYVISELTGYEDHPDENDPTAPKKDYVERYAFMWDTDRVHLVDNSVPYRFVVTPAINNDVFRQVPIISDFEVNNGRGFDFRILTVHTVYNEQINVVRRAEIQFIHDWIIDQSNNDTNTEKNVFAVGDFNANPEGQPHHFDSIVTGTNAYRVLMNEPLSAGEPSLRTTIQQSNNPGPGYFEKPVYDHVLVTNQTSYALTHNPATRAAEDVGIVEFDQDTDWRDQRSWDDVIRAMSDHRPVWFKLDHDAADLD